MKVGLANIFTYQETLDFNLKTIESYYSKALVQELDLLVLPHLALTGVATQDNFCSKNFLNNYIEKLQKILTLTEEQKTDILLPSLYYDEERLDEDGILHRAELYDAGLFIVNGCLEDWIFRKEIARDNFFNDYRYFDKAKYLRCFTYKGKKIMPLLADDIYYEYNIFLIKDQNPDYIFCLDTSPKTNENHLLKLQRFTGKPIIYLNSAALHQNTFFNGKIILINEDGAIVLNKNYSGDEMIVFELDCEDGSEMMLKEKPKAKQNTNFALIKKLSSTKTVVVDVSDWQDSSLDKLDKFLTTTKTSLPIAIDFKARDYKNIEAFSIADYILPSVYDKIYNKTLQREILLKTKFGAEAEIINYDFTGEEL